ncbi:hypothetical protein LSH36_879g00081 [Paralvinella palmiformis]|uniref:BLOC-1-related complex subunit 7 n=1 Tax=Paralvinella palmiformis TaxID=53620 RepID=A0AAD9IYW6_9ANNE|nr:hypothetical protein LSH36_879g00081 [Paralvinella palmiformis]
MTGASGWNQETKCRLSDKVTANMNDIASLCKQLIRGSRSSDLLEKAAKNFVYQEANMENSSTNIKKMGLLVSHLQFQAEAIERSVQKMDDIQDQLKTMEK